jgi:hypothetical protein
LSRGPQNISSKSAANKRRRSAKPIPAARHRLAGIRQIHLGVTGYSWRQRLRKTQHFCSHVPPIDVCEIEVFPEAHDLLLSVMHEDSKEKNDRQRDSDEPEQRAFSERHFQSPLRCKCTPQRSGVPQGSITPMLFVGRKKSDVECVAAIADVDQSVYRRQPGRIDQPPPATCF